MSQAICDSLTTGSYTWLSVPAGCGDVQTTGNGTGFSCTGADGQTVNLGTSGQPGPSDGSNGSVANNGTQQQSTDCTSAILSAVNDQFGTNFTQPIRKWRRDKPKHRWNGSSLRTI